MKERIHDRLDVRDGDASTKEAARGPPSECADDGQRRDQRGDAGAKFEHLRAGEKRERSENLQLLFGRERPAAFYASRDVIREERPVTPLVRPRRRERGRENHDQKIERPNAKSATQDEPAHVDRVRSLELLPRLTADQESAEDEEEVDASPTELEYRTFEEVRVAGELLLPKLAEVTGDHHQDRDCAQCVERGDLARGRDPKVAQSITKEGYVSPWRAHDSPNMQTRHRSRQMRRVCGVRECGAKRKMTRTKHRSSTREGSNVARERTTRRSHDRSCRLSPHRLGMPGRRSSAGSNEAATESEHCHIAASAVVAYVHVQPDPIKTTPG